MNRSRRFARAQVFFAFAFFATSLTVVALFALSVPLEWYALALVCEFGSMGAMAWCAAERDRL